MRKIKRPAFLPGLLALCLIIGATSGLLRTSTRLVTAAALTVSVLVLVAAHWLAPILNGLPRRRINQVLGAGLLVMVIGQILVLTFMPVTVYHDAYRVLAQADKMAAGHMTWNITYFWRYPNNVPITFFLSLWLRLTNVLGLSTNLAIHLLSLILLDGFILLVLATIRRVTQRASVLIGAFALMAATPFAYTYFLQVFYSDLPDMLVLLVIFRTLLLWPTQTRRQRIINGTLLGIAVLFGQLTKPNLIVLLPAIAVVGWLVFRQKALKATALGVPLAIILLGFALSTPATQMIRKASNYQPHTEFALPVTSWLLMGVNTSSQGMYSGTDVSHEIQLSSKTRQTYDVATITARVKKLGIGGLLQLWLTKLRTFFTVRDILTWGDGGFRAAPAWYQKHAAFIEALTALSYQIATDALLFLVAWRLWGWRPQLRAPRDAVLLLTIVTALGYIAFHTLLWEVEERYGQVLLPLLLYQLAALPVPARQTDQTQPDLALVALAAALTALPLLAHTIVTLTPQSTVVAAQRSQLSTQYHAKAATVAPGTVLTEKVALNGPATYFSVQIHLNTTVQVTLRNVRTNQVYRLHRSGDVYRWTKALPQGTYQIAVKNTTSQDQRVNVVRTYHYQLASQPLVVNGHVHPTDSLIYTSLNQTKTN